MVLTLAVGACAATPPDGNGTASGGSHASSGGSTGTGGAKGSGGATGTGGSGTSAGSCTPGKVPAGTLFSPFDAMPVTTQAPDGREYFLQVNEWNNTAAQTMTYGGNFFFKMTRQDAKVATTGAPAGYPSHFIGSNAGHVTVRSNLPKAVTALTTIPTSWTWNDAGTLADPTNNSYNVAYDVWFSTSSAGDSGSPSGGFLMVWYHKPSDAQPVGSRMFSSVTIAGVPGFWDVWIGPNAGKQVISYVSQQDLKSFSYDLNNFIQDAVKNRPNTIQSSWYLTNVFAGFEIWRGGLNLESTSFCVVVN